MSIRYDGATQGAGSASEPVELITIDVCVQRINHRSPTSHWHALSIAHSEFATAAGDIDFAVEKGDCLRLTGLPSQYRNKPQLAIIGAERVLPEFHDPHDVIFARYGITKNRLCALREAYGDDFAECVIADPGKIKQLFPRFREAGRNKILKACAHVVALKAQGSGSVRAARALYRALLSVQAPSAVIKRARSFNIEKRSIYSLCEAGLSFAKADAAARSPYLQSIVPFNPHDPERVVEAARQHLESQCRLRGDGGMPLGLVHKELSSQYGLPDDAIMASLPALADARGMTVDNGENRTIWRKAFLVAEHEIAKIAADNIKPSRPKKSRISTRPINVFPGSAGERCIDLDEPQRRAVQTVLENRLSAVIGRPGTGKTSCLAHLAQNTSRMAVVSLAARAARHAGDVTGCEHCYTVAQVIGDKTGGYRGDLTLIEDLDVLVIEEASMIGSEQMARLLGLAFEQGTARVALFGDINQLQPIDPGSPFHDLVDCGAIPVARLETVYRQKDGSGIRELLEDVLADALLIKDYSSCVFHWCLSESETANQAVRCHTELITEHGVEDCIIIAPFKTGGSGVHALNRGVRMARGFTDELPRSGEILMAQRNDYGAGFLNGMRLVVVDGAKRNNKTFKARPFGSPDPIELPCQPHAHGPSPGVEWGYACTVHKFQGSEAAAVIVAIPPDTIKIIGNEPWLFDKSAVYTAFSRAKEHLSVVDAGELIKIGCYDRRRRVTALPDLLREAVRQEAIHG
jgi:AAA domain/UvrD-like helicase C-terminal domain